MWTYLRENKDGDRKTDSQEDARNDLDEKRDADPPPSTRVTGQLVRDRRAVEQEVDCEHHLDRG